MSELGQQLSLLKTLSAPELADALDACGLQGYVPGIKPIGVPYKICGPAYTIQYEPYQQRQGEFAQASQYIDDIPSGYVVVIDNQGLATCSVWGGILTHFASRHGLKGTVVHGLVRDIEALDKYQYPVYSQGVIPVSAKNRSKMIDKACTLNIQGIRIAYQDIIFADVHGVLVLPLEHLDSVLEKAQQIQRNEKNIVESINQGMTLKQARERFHYDKPWTATP